MAEESARIYKDQYMLRLPDGMRDRIKAAAAHNGRSMNLEIVHALTYWLELELPYETEFGPRSDPAKIGKQDWEDGRKEREQDYKRELQQSIWLMQRLLREISVGEGRYDDKSPVPDGTDDDA